MEDQMSENTHMSFKTNERSRELKTSKKELKL